MIDAGLVWRRVCKAGAPASTPSEVAPSGTVGKGSAGWPETISVEGTHDPARREELRLEGVFEE